MFINITNALEGVESPHSTAYLLNFIDSILHATILPVRFFKILRFESRFNYIYIYICKSLALVINALYKIQHEQAIRVKRKAVLFGCTVCLC